MWQRPEGQTSTRVAVDCVKDATVAEGGVVDDDDDGGDVIILTAMMLVLVPMLLLLLKRRRRTSTFRFMFVVGTGGVRS